MFFLYDDLIKCHYEVISFIQGQQTVFAFTQFSNQNRTFFITTCKLFSLFNLRPSIIQSYIVHNKAVNANMEAVIKLCTSYPLNCAWLSAPLKNQYKKQTVWNVRPIVYNLLQSLPKFSGSALKKVYAPLV